MAYGREQLRRAGEALLNLDERYADAVRSKSNPGVAFTSGMPLRNLKPEGTADSSIEALVGAATIAGLGSSNIAARYALPAGGITLAGKGLIDLTGMLVGPEEQSVGTVMP